MNIKLESAWKKSLVKASIHGGMFACNTATAANSQFYVDGPKEYGEVTPEPVAASDVVNAVHEVNQPAQS